MRTLILILSLFVSPVAAQRESHREIEMIVTAYCPCKSCCGKDAKGITATGKDARICDGVAAAKTLLPYGTRLNIPGAGEKVVDDTGGAMREDAKKGIYHIDLRMPTHKEALEWGRQKLKVLVYPTIKK